MTLDARMRRWFEATAAASAAWRHLLQPEDPMPGYAAIEMVMDAGVERAVAESLLFSEAARILEAARPIGLGDVLRGHYERLIDAVRAGGLNEAGQVWKAARNWGGNRAPRSTSARWRRAFLNKAERVLAACRQIAEAP